MNGIAERNPARPMGLIALLATTTMLFTAFTASYLARETSADWRPIDLPAPAYANLVVLAASSIAVELARRERDGCRRREWIATTIALGAGFLIGQVLTFAHWAGSGMFLGSNPHAAFAYLLSGVHALHLLGGLGALSRAWLRPASLPSCAVYWHFVGWVWVWILVLLFWM